MDGCYAFEKNKVEKILENLNDILQRIEEIEKVLENEIINSELELYYEGNLKYKSYSFNNMTYQQINTFIFYQKKINTYDECLKLDELKDKIQELFYNKLLETSCMLKIPISYLLTASLDKLIFAIEDFNQEYYFLFDGIIFSKEQIDKLKIKVINDIHIYNLKIYEFNKKYEKFKADSEYIKRNKK